MKKLLSFLVAGIAALGLASCSGDLHNEIDPNSALAKALFDTSIKIEDFETFELCGSMTADDPAVWKNDAAHNVKFVKNEEDGTWEADFLSTNQDDQKFCFITKTGQWDEYQIGGESMEAGTLPDGVTFTSKPGEGKHEDAILSGLKKKSFYKMIVDASSGKYVISIEKSTATPFYLVGAFVRGSMNNGNADGTSVLVNPLLDRKTNELTYTYDFDLSANGDWSQGDTNSIVSFGITFGSNWDAKYTGGTFAFGTDTDFVQTTYGAQNNNLITGLNNAKAYRLIIKTTPEKAVSFKVIEIAKYTLNLVVTGLPDSANGKTAIFAGTYNDWKFTSAWGKNSKVSDCTNAVIASNEANFGEIKSGIADLGDTVTVSGCGYYGTVVSDDIATTDGEIKIGGDNAVIEFELTGSGSYTATIDLENDEVTVTKD